MGLCTCLKWGPVHGGSDAMKNGEWIMAINEEATDVLVARLKNPVVSISFKRTISEELLARARNLNRGQLEVLRDYSPELSAKNLRAIEGLINNRLAFDERSARSSVGRVVVAA